MGKTCDGCYISFYQGGEFFHPMFFFMNKSDGLVLSGDRSFRTILEFLEKQVSHLLEQHINSLKIWLSKESMILYKLIVRLFYLIESFTNLLP